MYTKVTEGNYTAEFLMSEANGYRSREMIELAMREDMYKAGMVLGKLIADTVAAPAADGGNTGNGTVTAVTAGAKTEPGDYILICVAAETDAGTFEIHTPSGQQLPNDATVAVAYASDHLNFTINDGGTDFAVGDKFTITVSGSGQYTQLDQDAVDGSQVAAGILYGDVDASAADAPGVGVVRDAETKEALLIWPDGADEDQGKAELANLGILVRA